MVEFYSIGKENSEIENQFQLKSLGEQRIFMSIGGTRRNWEETSNYKSQHFYTKVTTEDYDRLFADRLIKIKPAYEINKFLDYHLNCYLNKDNSTKDKFFKHIKYVVVPEVKKKKDKDVYVQLIGEWIEENDDQIKNNMSNLNIGNIHAPTQIQINSNGNVQKQTLKYSNDDILELFELIKADLKDKELDCKDDLIIEIENATKHVKNDKDITSRLKTIGGLIKDVGINVFANVLAAPIYDRIKDLL